MEGAVDPNEDRCLESDEKNYACWSTAEFYQSIDESGYQNDDEFIHILSDLLDQCIEDENQQQPIQVTLHQIETNLNWLNNKKFP